MKIIEDSTIPRGTVYLVHADHEARIMDLGPLRIERDPWPPTSLPEPAATERRKGLDHLASLVDEVYRGWGMDPEEKWRAPRLAAQDRNRFGFVASTRIGMSVRKPGDFVRVTHATV